MSRRHGFPPGMPETMKYLGRNNGGTKDIYLKTYADYSRERKEACLVVYNGSTIRFVMCGYSGDRWSVERVANQRGARMSLIRADTEALGMFKRWLDESGGIVADGHFSVGYGDALERLAV